MARTKLYDVSVSFNGGRTWILLGPFEGEDDRYAIRAARQDYQLDRMVLATAVPSTSDVRKIAREKLEPWRRCRAGQSGRIVFPT